MRRSHTTTPPPTVELEMAMHEIWYDLIAAEARGADDATLERLFARYRRALEALVAARQGSSLAKQRAA